MMKSLTWLLSFSSLFALSRPGNGALLPRPGARPIPIVERDGAQQPVRRQDCPAPGPEVDQAKLFTDICNTNPQNDFVTCYNALLAMAQEAANGYCALQYEVYNACLVLNNYDTITCGDSRLRFLNCSKETLQAFAICTCYYTQPSPLYTCANFILQFRPKSPTIEIPTASSIDTSLLLTAPIVTSTAAIPSLPPIDTSLLFTEPIVPPSTPTASLAIDPSLLFTASIVPSTTIASPPIDSTLLPDAPDVASFPIPASLALTESLSEVTPSLGADVPIGSGILPRELISLPGLPNLPIPIPILPTLPAGVPNVPTLPVRPSVLPVPVLPIPGVPTVPVPPVPIIPTPAVPTIPVPTISPAIPVPPRSPAIPVPGVPILPVIPIRPPVSVLSSIPGSLPATISESPSIPIATPGLPTIPGLPVTPPIPGLLSVPIAAPGLPTITGLPAAPSIPVAPPIPDAPPIPVAPSIPVAPTVLPTTIPNGQGTAVGFPNTPTVPTTTPCTTFTRFETITATFRQALFPFYTITYSSAVTSTLLSVENEGRETGIGVGVCGGIVTSTIIY